MKTVSVTLLCLLLTQAAVAGQPWLVKDGKAQADIVTPENLTRGVKLAAKELRTYLAKISGAELAVVTAPDSGVPNHIYVDRSAWTDKLGVDTQELGQDMYKVVSGDNWLALLGGDAEFAPSEPWCKSRADRPRMQSDWEKRTGRTWRAWDLTTFKGYNQELDIWDGDGVGSLYAVHDFLRGLGVEWYLPGELGEVVPKSPDIVLPNIAKTVKPAVRFRTLTFVDFSVPGTREDVLWYFRLGLGRPPQGFGHSMQVILGDSNNRVKHPEYYALYNGKRDFFSRGGKPCLSSAGLLQQMTDYAKAFFDTYPEAEAFPIMPTDGFSNMCQCELCKGKDTPGRGYSGSLSDYVWGFVNQVAGEIAKSHPGKKIGCCSYSSYAQPPEQVKLHDNVIVMLCRSRQNDTNNPDNRECGLSLRQAWQAKLPPGSLYTWDYYLNSRGDSRGLPIFFPHAIATDMKSWEGVLQGEFIEVLKENGRLGCPALNHLNIFVTARLYWYPGQDVDKLLDTYFRQFFGPAADEMRRFHERAEKSFTNYTADALDDLLRTLDAAGKLAATDAACSKRVALLRQECEPKLRELLLQKREAQEYAKVELATLPDSGFAIDGLLNEPAWSARPELALVDCVTGAAPKTPTKFRLAADSANLYLAVVCQEPGMDTLKAFGSKRDDTNVWLDDAVELILKTPEHSYYQFAFNPNAAMVDVDWKKGGLDGVTWDSGAIAAVAKGPDTWTLELRLPLKDIDGSKPTPERPWSVNIGRSRPRDAGGETTIFVPSGKGTFHNLDKMAALAIQTAAVEPTGANLLPNPGIEEGDKLPLGWAAVGADSTFVWDKTTVHDGKRSLLIRNADREGSAAWQTTCALKPGVLYRLTAWVKMAKAKEGNGVVLLRVRGGPKVEGKRWEVTSESVANTNGQWRQLRLDFTPPPEIDSANLWLWLLKGNGDQVWFDDARLVEISGK